MSLTRILCEKCGFPLAFCACDRLARPDGPDNDSPASIPSPAAVAAAREIHSPLADIEAVRRTAAIIDRHFPAQSRP